MINSDITPGLERFIARKLYSLTTEQWRAMDPADRKSRTKMARRLLKQERAYLDRKANSDGNDETPEEV